MQPTLLIPATPTLDGNAAEITCAQAERRLEGIEAECGRSREPLHILCADDNEQISRVLEQALEHAGYLVETVENGEKALGRMLVDLGHFDILVTDHQMPWLSGLNLVERLRAVGFPGRIIVHSSRLTDAETSAYRALRVDEILSKPTALTTLLLTIRQWERKRS